MTPNSPPAHLSHGIRTLDLGRLPYRAAYDVQCRHHDEILAARQTDRAEVARILLVEHDPPVITVSRRPGAADHILADNEALRRAGVQVEQTDRGGDITYHGPGQLVAYPIVDLAALKLGVHAYMRLLEDAVIETCAHFGVQAGRDACATGVWVGIKPGQETSACAGSKICAMGVRVRKWVTLHGLAINVTTDLSHFGLIVPCGLHGRTVTSLQNELAAASLPAPDVDGVKPILVAALAQRFAATASRLDQPAE